MGKCEIETNVNSAYAVLRTIQNHVEKQNMIQPVFQKTGQSHQLNTFWSSPIHITLHEQHMVTGMFIGHGKSR